jgi:acetyl-CoA C-acetyltransferase
MNFKNTPYSEESGLHLGKYARSVSIIGVGLTPFGNVLKTASMFGMSQKDLAAWAFQEAIADSGVNPRDIGMLCFAQAAGQSHYAEVAANIYMTDWFGMRGRPSSLHSEACCSSYCAFDEAVNGIASGKYDIALVVGSDTPHDHVNATQPSHKRYSNKEFQPAGSWGGSEWIILQQIDSAYSRWNGTHTAWSDESAVLYMRKHGLTREQMEDVIDALTITLRHNGAKNPLALHQEEMEDEAKENGFDNVRDYLRRPANWFFTPLHRRSSVLANSDGAGAMILCASDIASQYKKKPIDVLGVGISSMDCRYPRFMTRLIEESYRQVFEQTGVKGEEIDLMFTTDFLVTSILQNAEMCGYVPEGEGWKMALHGEFRYEGSKPINTHGGSISFSHAFGAQLFEQGVEAVHQMRGECGERQVKRLPKTVFISGFGDSQENAAILLRTQE